MMTLLAYFLVTHLRQPRQPHRMPNRQWRLSALYLRLKASTDSGGYS